MSPPYSISLRVMEVLYFTPGSSATDVAKKLVVPTSQANACISQLYKNGHLQRRWDGRRYRYALADAEFPPLPRETRKTRPQPPTHGICDTCGRDTDHRSRPGPGRAGKLTWRCVTCCLSANTCSIFHKWDRETYPRIRKELLEREAEELALLFLSRGVTRRLLLSYEKWEVPKRIPIDSEKDFDHSLMGLHLKNDSPTLNELHDIRALRVWERRLSMAMETLKQRHADGKSHHLRTFEDHQVNDHTYEMAAILTGDAEGPHIERVYEWLTRWNADGAARVRCERCGEQAAWSPAKMRVAEFEQHLYDFYVRHGRCLPAGDGFKPAVPAG